jgi:asparagine synthase (glutamine-hydrolysing)
MASGIEGRLPYLDDEVFRIAKSFHPSALISPDQEKLVLRAALKNVIPEAVSVRRKHPLVAPPTLCAENAASTAFLRDWAHSSELQSSQFVDPGKIQELVKRIPSLTPVECQQWDAALWFCASCTALQSLMKNDGKWHDCAVAA